jgi:hypothetical protein
MTASVLTRAGVAATLATLAVSGVASAKAGDKTFEQTYPRASQLCTNVAQGQGPKRLRPHAAQVAAACAKLRATFDPASAQVKQAQSDFAAGVASARARIQAACAPLVKDRATCRQTRRAERGVIASLRRQHKAAVRAYRTTIEAGRRTFWSTIRLLAGGRAAPEDGPISRQGD